MANYKLEPPEKPYGPNDELPPTGRGGGPKPFVGGAGVPASRRILLALSDEQCQVVDAGAAAQGINAQKFMRRLIMDWGERHRRVVTSHKRKKPP